MSSFERKLKIIVAWASLGAAGVWGLVSYVDARVANAPWVKDKPYVLKILEGGFERIEKRLDRIEEKMEKYHSATMSK